MRGRHFFRKWINSNNIKASKRFNNFYMELFRVFKCFLLIIFFKICRNRSFRIENVMRGRQQKRIKRPSVFRSERGYKLLYLENVMRGRHFFRN